MLKFKTNIKIHKSLIYLVLLVVFILYSGLVLNRPSFFDWDEWSIIINFLETDYNNWLFQKHLGHINPVGKFFYSLELLIFRDKYYLYILVNIILHTINSFIIYNIIYKVVKLKNLSLVSTLLYFSSWNHIENLLWGMQISVFLSTMFVLIILRLIVINRFKNKIDITWIIILLLCSSFSFSLGITMPTFLIIFISFKYGFRENINPIITFAITQIIIFLLYLTIYNIQFEYIHKGASTNQFNFTEYSLKNLERSILHLIHAVVFAPIYFLTTISASLVNNEVNVILTSFKEFNLFQFVGSRKFFLLIITLIFLYNFRLRPNYSFLYNLILFFFLLIPSTILISISKSYNYETIFQCRYYSYIGVFVIFLFIQSIIIRINDVKIKKITIITIIALLIWNFLFTLNYLIYSKYKYNSINVKDTYSKVNQCSNPGTSIFNPLANPELTLEQAKKIHNFMND